MIFPTIRIRAAALSLLAGVYASASASRSRNQQRVNAAQGFEAGGMPPEQTARVIRIETQRWAKVIRDGNIHAE